ncbi:hypothetical protein PF003_g9847 [Phytophthora fragariae]|nr:hypothetical protein PF003_g9845 [Phytophthora fragariae]KAE8906350.1 hypothetical protein PF003_g9847 [Phytophthora fragariae]
MGSSVWLKNAKYFGENFQPGDGQVHVLVVLPEDEGDSGPALKKARLEDDRDLANELMGRIRGCDSNAIFDIKTVVKLPFPSLVMPPNRFQVVEGSFEYQARSDLKCLYEKVVAFWSQGKRATVKVVGTIGYGKSHMLAVLVLLLLKNQVKNRFGSLPFVCYIPDCKTLLARESAILTILHQNIVLNIPDFAEPLNTIEEVRAVMQGKMVILVADQWNSIDENQMVIDRLGSCLGISVYVEIHGMSMNAKTWRDLLPKQTSDDRNIYCGGFNDDEFGVWLKHHPPFFTEHEDELALLTGKVPMLLSAFARVYREGDSWESVVERVQRDATMVDWAGLLSVFYKEKDVELVWKVFTLKVDYMMESEHVDHRFFYKDPSRGFRATSELVLRLLYRVWSTKSADDALLTKWPDLVFHAVNRSTLGFYVEEIIKAQICRQGVVGKYPRPNDRTIRRYRFDPASEKLTLNTVLEEREAKSWWILLDPPTFNYPGVDMILVTDTKLVGINVTIAKTHSPLEPFFKMWTPLAASKNMAITGLFVAPDNFVHEEDNVDISLLRNVYYELWQAIEMALLKKAIKDEKPNKIKCDADGLQLFLAKKGNGTWLDEVGVVAAALNWRGNSQGFEPMGPSLWLKNAKYFEENFQPGEGQVHMLVLVPEGEGHSGPA